MSSVTENNIIIPAIDRTIWKHTGLYGAIQNYMEIYRTVESHTRLYGALKDDEKPHRLIWSQTG